MKPLIISNNPSVIARYDEAFFVSGDFIDVLYKVRDLIHKGHQLISHPLGSSGRMMSSPYRSVLVSIDAGPFNAEHCGIVESSIEMYHAKMGLGEADHSSGKDYELIDLELLESSLSEADIITDTKEL